MDLEKADLERIDADNQETLDKILEMRITWRRKEAGYNDIKVLNLCNALIKVGRADVANTINTAKVDKVKNSNTCHLV